MADDFCFVKRIKNELGFLEPEWLRIGDNIYILVDNPEYVKIIKTDLELNTIWAKEYAFNFFEENNPVNYSNSFVLNDGAKDDNDDIIFVGKRYTGYNQEKGILFKISSLNGEFIWYKQNNFSGNYSYDNIKYLGDNKYFIFNNSDYEHGLRFFLISNNGEYLKGKNFSLGIVGTTIYTYDHNYKTAVTENYIILVSGVFNSTGNTEIDRNHHRQHFLKLDHEFNTIEAFFIDFRASDELAYSNVVLAIVNNEIHIYAKQTSSDVLYGLKLPVEDSQNALSSKSYELSGIGSETNLYFSELNETAIYAFYHSGNSTFFYKFNKNLQPLWKKEVDKRILKLQSTKEEIMTSFFYSEEDDSISFCKMNSDFDICNCLDISDLEIAIVQTEITVQLTESSYANYIDTRELKFIDFSLEGRDIESFEIENVCEHEKIPDLIKSTITSSPTTIDADGSSISTITVTLLDSEGIPFTEYAEVVVKTTLGLLSNVIYNGDGSYSTTLTSDTVGNAIISFNVDGENAANNVEVNIKQILDLAQSTITSDKESILANGESTAEITVTLKSEDGEPYTESAEVALKSTLGLLSNVMDNGDGTYSTTLTSDTVGNAIISFSVDGENASDTEEVNIKQILDLAQSTIISDKESILANGESRAEITVTLKSEDGDPYTESAEVAINSTLGLLSYVMDNGDGSYSTTLTSDTVGNAIISFSIDGENASDTEEVFIESTNKITCPAHVALVVDESGSISNTEAAQIRIGLQSFVDTQIGSNLTVSLIGMSLGDVNTRNDHILQQKITLENRQLFDGWVTAYRNRGVDNNADYWASGLEVLGEVDTPDIIILIADGLQVTDYSVLFESIKRNNNISHIFTYAVNAGSYEGADSVGFNNITESLAFYLERTPIPISDTINILTADYQPNIGNFIDLGNALKGLNDTLIKDEVGCGNIELASTNFTTIRLRPNDSLSELQIGTLTFDNKKSFVHTLEAGTIIASVSGVSFVVLETVEIAGNSGGIATVIATGTPIESGDYSEIISIAGILNPNELSVDFTILPTQVTCPAHVAFLVDESGSINNWETQEIPEIRESLRSFVELQKYSNLKISLVGLSNQDTNTRNDHILRQLVTDETIDQFNNWLDDYRTNRVSSVSHHWSSGLNLVTDVDDEDALPDIIIIIADGADVDANQILLDAVKKGNNRSHIFVYALSQGLYHNGQNWSQRNLEDTLTFFFNRDLKPSTRPDDILITDYVKGINSFEALGSALRSLNDALIEAEVGCGNIEITATDFEEITLYSRVEVEDIAYGTITLNNAKSSDHIIQEGTQLVTINGVTITTVEETVIGNFESGQVKVQLSGTPELNGEYEEIISVIGVLNPEEFVAAFKVIALEKILHTQSPFMYLQAAGSTGEDGTLKGVHLRWIFKNALGDNHLPKGNEAGNSNGFNKADDFVTVYKIPYEKEQIEIDFSQKPNYATTSFRRFRTRTNKPLWVYELEGNRYILHFDNTSQYIASAKLINPREFPLEFLNNYGNNLITLETRNSLAFSVEFILNSAEPNATLQTELVGAEEKLADGLKEGIVARKAFASNEFGNTYQQAEDIKYVRFIANNCIPEGIKLEMYSTLVDEADREKLWEELGTFSLTTNNSEAFERLEPRTGTIDATWPRFNDGDLVNIDNYKDKWDNNKTGEFEKDIKQVVTDYITESNDPNNPKGTVSVSFNEDIDDDSDTKEIAYLDILNIASADYHIARMLGLGCFDLDEAAHDDQFVYAIKYTTKNEIKDYVYDNESEDFVVEHIYVSLPTSINEQRLPKTYDITKVIPGVPKGEYEWTDDDGNIIPSTSLLDEEGYSNQGKTRFVSIYSPDDEENELLLDFFTRSEEFNSSHFTEPVYGGIEYKHNEDLDASLNFTGSWDKPELSISDEYFNKVISGAVTPETIPLGIPDKNKPLYVHMQREEGVYHYATYGINWFSRTSPIEKSIAVKTEFIPDNSLLPPNNVNALHIVEERPLLLTSVNEQLMLREAIEINKDVVIVRLAFNYSSSQELQSYKITDEIEQKAIQKFGGTGDEALMNENAVVKDEKELFADEVEIFFRNELPRNIQGKVSSIIDDPSDERISVIETENYTQFSTGAPDEDYEVLQPKLPLGASANDFQGGVFTTNGENFFVKSIVSNSESVTIYVYKNDLENNVQVGILPSPDAVLVGPTIQADALFMLVENMSEEQSWGAGNPNQSFKVQLTIPESETIHREIISIADGADNEPERILEKTRGFWGNAYISEEEQITNFDETTGEAITEHLGLYKLECNFKLPNHPQSTPDSKGNFINWNGGIVRIHTNNDTSGPRRVLNVVRILNIGNSSDNVILYAKDDLVTAKIYDDNDQIVENDTILTDDNIEINFYPGFKAYLYTDPAFNLTKESITPTDEFLKYSIFGLRSVDNDTLERYGTEYKSPISTPATMFVHKIVEPLQPEEPKGAFYANKPDSFGKATYTLQSSFQHEPYGILYFRANDRSILGALYMHETANEIIAKLESYNPDIFYSNRWEDLFNFESVRTDFDVFPKTGDNGFRFPLPDKPAFFEAIDLEIKYANERYNENFPLVNRDNFDLSTEVIPKIESEALSPKTIGYFVEQAVMNAFVSLTEVPLLYDYIKGEDYQPSAKRQIVRDRDGNLLAPSNDAYDASPMAKRIPSTSGEADEVLFTDFKLDGTSKNTYFYTCREMGSTSQIGPFSSIKGPVKLVNTKAPENPAIKRVLPVLANSDFDYELQEFIFEDVENISLDAEFKVLTKIGGADWDAGLASKQILKGNTYATFSLIENTEAVIGFSSFNQNAYQDTIQYGLHVKPNNRLHVVIEGNDLGEVGTYSANAIFKIEIKGSLILFYRDEVQLFEEKLIKATNFVLDISIKNTNGGIFNLELYTIANTYTTEYALGENIPLSLTNLENIEISDEGIISKIPDVGADIWDTGAHSEVFLPYYCALSFKVLNNTSVMVGLANELVGQKADDKIDYALYVDKDGYLYVAINGEKITSKCVSYDADSTLGIERRNQILIFKKNGRQFFELPLASNEPLFLDFAMYSANSQIIDLKTTTLNSLELNYDASIINPRLSFEVNAYQPDQRIRKLNLYRATTPENALSIRTMQLVNSIDLVTTNQLDANILKIDDDFTDLTFVPYSDPLYYRVTVSREVEYAKPKKDEDDPNTILTDYTPSNPSKILVSSIVESTSPKAPAATFGYDEVSVNDSIIENVLLKWNRTVYNGKYHVYAMNSQGNWVKIHEVISNDEEIQLFLSETDLEGTLQIKDEEGNAKYQHFKIDAENSAGMLNVKSNIITIPGASGRATLEGVGSMVIENTNLVR